MNDCPKVYFSISEVCARTGLEPHVLRYWETEFSQLRPKKNRAGNRAYREKDIEIIEIIKNLLYEEKFTIPGAKKRLSESKEHEADPVTADPKNNGKKSSSGVSFSELKRELCEVLRLLRE